MRFILRKIKRQEKLTEEEYRSLMKYVKTIKEHSPESWNLFYKQYANLLARDYCIYMSRFSYDLDDLYEYLIHHSELLDLIKKQPLPYTSFPYYLHEYIINTIGEIISYATIEPLMALFKVKTPLGDALPMARKNRLIIKYEDNNPYKEQGLKYHFERIAHYSFVSRIQTYRYLSRKKASFDRIELISPDCLGGIFTNKEKSIYYYIFLTEADPHKALNACKVLNLALYGIN